MTWLSEERPRLEAFRRGDPAVLVQVYERYAPRLLEQLGARERRARPFDLADLVQETFVRALSPRGREQYDGLRPFATYLLAIANNLAVDRWRTESRRQRLHDEHPAHLADEQAERTGPDPDAAAEAAELRRVLDGFLADLAPHERLLVQLRFVDAQPRRVVSEQTGMSAMRVRLVEARLRRRLVLALEERGYPGAAELLPVWLALLGLSLAGAGLLAPELAPWSHRGVA